MQTAEARLRELLDQRVAVLDGAWGTMLQGAGLTPEDYRGDLLADHPRDVTGDPDLLNLTRPDVILDVHRQYLAAGADITTTNTFTATSIGQADYGLQHLVREMNLRGAQLARQAADEVGGKFVAGSIGPLNVTLSLSPRVEDPAYRAVTLRRGPRRVRRADRGAGRGRRRPAAHRDDLRHAQREGRDRRGPRRRARPAAVDLGHHRRPVRPHAVRPDRRGVLELDRARQAAGRRRELLAGREGDAPARRGAVPAGRHLHGLPPQRRPAQRVRRLRPDAGGDRRTARRVRRGRHWSTSSAAAAAPRPRTSPGSPAAAADRAPRPMPAPAGRHPVQRSGAVRDRRGHRLRDDRRADQRDRLGPVPPAHRVRRPPGRRGRGAGAGTRRREPAGRQHGRRPAGQRAGDDHVPEPDRDRARGRPDPDHGRQLAVDGAGSRAALRAGQGRGQLDQPQGGRGAVPGAGSHHPRLRRRCRRDGVRRAGPGRHRRAQGRDLRPRLRPADPEGRTSRPRTSCSTRTCSRSRPACPSTTATPRRSSRRCR